MMDPGTAPPAASPQPAAQPGSRGPLLLPPPRPGRTRLFRNLERGVQIDQRFTDAAFRLVARADVASSSLIARSWIELDRLRKISTAPAVTTTTTTRPRIAHAQVTHFGRTYRRRFHDGPAARGR